MGEGGKVSFHGDQKSFLAWASEEQAADARNSRANNSRNTFHSKGTGNNMGYRATALMPVTLRPTTEETSASAWVQATTWAVGH
jgi:hypothetical protein